MSLSLGLGLALTRNKGVGVDARYGIDIFAARSVGQTRFRNGLRSSSSLTDIATVTRATTAWGVDQAGVLSSFAAGQPVVTTAGLQVWEARANAYLYSQVYTNAAWTSSGVTVVDNAAVAPDGTTTAASHTPNNGTTSFTEVIQNVSITSGTTYCYSTFVKRGGLRYVQFLGSSACFGTFAFNVDLDTGLETYYAAGTSTVVGRGVVPLASGWYRVWVAVTAIGTGSSRLLMDHITGATDTRGSSQTFSSAGATYRWGDQIEVGASASPYIPTTTAAVTRNADVITEAVNIPVGQAFTITCKCIAPSVEVLTWYPRVFSISDTGDNLAVNIIELMLNGVSAYMRPKSGAGTLIDVNVGSGLVAAGAPVGIALSVNGATVTTSVNGVAPVTHTMAGGPFSAAILKLHLGRAFNIPSTYFLNSTIRDLNIVMRAYSAAELQAASDVSLVWDEDFTTQTYRYVGDPYLAVTDLPMTTFTRPSGGYGVNSAGLLVWFAAGALRATDAGLTVEPAATNLLLRSQDFSQSVWNKGTGGAISADSVLAPDGTMTADAYTWPTTTSSYAFLSQTVSGNASVAVASAIYLKVPSGTRNVRLSISNVSVATVSGADMTLTTSWQRVPFAIAAAALANTGQIGVGLNTGSTNSVVAGEVIHVWGAQLETGSFATSYIPTTTAAVTRNADVLVSNDNAPAAYTEVVSFTPRAVNDGATHHVLCLSDGTPNNRVTLAIIANGHLVLNVVTAGAVQASLDLGLLTAGVSYKCAFRIAANDVAASLAGAAVATDLTVAVPVTTLVHRGMWLGGGEALTGELRTRARYSVGKTNAELQALSA